MSSRKILEQEGSSDQSVASDMLQKLLEQMGRRIESKTENLGNKNEAFEKRMNESFGKSEQEMKDDVKKLEGTIGHITEEVKHVNDKMVAIENKIEETDKEFKKHLHFFALMVLTEKEYCLRLRGIQEETDEGWSQAGSRRRGSVVMKGAEGFTFGVFVLRKQEDDIAFFFSFVSSNTLSSAPSLKSNLPENFSADKLDLDRGSTFQCFNYKFTLTTMFVTCSNIELHGVLECICCKLCHSLDFKERPSICQGISFYILKKIVSLDHYSSGKI
ncbi:UNVERIFIED_CONTAM: hypothetical protein K2H54_044827 [Gekko kuhli]